MSTTTNRLLISVLLALCASSIDAGTYYVAKSNSSDNYTGSRSQPWATIQKAASTLLAGDTVLIMRGTYREQVVPRNSGSSGRFIVYAAYPGDSVTIDGTGVTLSGWSLFQISSKNYIKVTGLKIANSVDYGLGEEGSGHIVFERNYIYNCVSSGIIAAEYTGRNNNIIIDGNEVELVCNDGAQECISLARTDTFEIKNNHVHHGGPGSNGGEGIDAKFGSNNGKIFGNYVHHLSRQGIYVDAWSDRTYNIEVYNNIVHDCKSDGFDCASEQGGILENVTFYNNIAYDNSFAGFAFRNWGGSAGTRRNIKVINNTFFHNGWGTWAPMGGIVVQGSGYENCVIRNNICSGNDQLQIYLESSAIASNFQIDHNLIDGYRGFAGETRGVDFVEGSAGFKDTAAHDFHLMATSPAINKGSPTSAPAADYDGLARPQGTAPDLGAYEYRDPVHVLIPDHAQHGRQIAGVVRSADYGIDGRVFDHRSQSVGPRIVRKRDGMHRTVVDTK